MLSIRWFLSEIFHWKSFSSGSLRIVLPIRKLKIWRQKINHLVRQIAAHNLWEIWFTPKLDCELKWIWDLFSSEICITFNRVTLQPTNGRQIWTEKPLEERPSERKWRAGRGVIGLARNLLAFPFFWPLASIHTVRKSDWELEQSASAPTQFVRIVQ